MHITQSILEAIREEFKECMEVEFGEHLTGKTMPVYDRATALALGKRFMSDNKLTRELVKPRREVREHPTLRNRRIRSEEFAKIPQAPTAQAPTAKIQKVLDACRKADSS